MHLPLTRWFILNSIALILFLGVGAQPALKAQTPFDKAIKVQQLYESLEFEKAVKYSRTILRENLPFSKEQLLMIHQFTAYAFFNLGKPDSAKKHFITILSIDPDYQLNPVITSPKIIKFYKEIKKEFASQKLAKNIAYTRYVFLEDLRPGAAWRSLLLPGWGQYYKGQKIKSKWIGVTFGCVSAFTILTIFMEKNYHKKYLDSKTPSEISKQYKNYNSWYKLRKISYITLGTVWLSSFFDALWTPYRVNQNISIRLKAQYSIPELAIRVSF